MIHNCRMHIIAFQTAFNYIILFILILKKKRKMLDIFASAAERRITKSGASK